jgi:hypothetical protein
MALQNRRVQVRFLSHLPSGNRSEPVRSLSCCTQFAAVCSPASLLVRSLLLSVQCVLTPVCDRAKSIPMAKARRGAI